MIIDKIAESVFRYFVAYQDKNDDVPTVREIMVGLNRGSIGQVHDALRGLAAAGLMRCIDGKHRNWRLTDEGKRLAERMKSIVQRDVRRFRPGQVRAGALIQEWQTVLSSKFDTPFPDDDDPNIIEISLSQLPANTDDLFALRVVGDSMIDALIREGDIVIVRRLPSLGELRNGMMVIVQNVADESVTLKYFRDAGDFIELIPANPNYPIQRIPKRDAAIFGVVVQVIRK